MTVHTAACSCGQLTATATAAPLRVSICHCLACQRRTGSVFGAQARFDAAAVKTAGRASVYVRTGDEGGQAHFHFCPDCGATVYYSVLGMPGNLIIPVGAFADPGFPAPEVSIYEARMHSWLGLPAGLIHID